MRVSARWMALLVSLAAMLPAYGHGHLDESSVEMRYARLQDVEDRTAGDARERARQMTLAFDRDLAAEYSPERLASASDRQLEVLFQAASRVVFYAHEPVHAALLQRAAQALDARSKLTHEHRHDLYRAWVVTRNFDAANALARSHPDPELQVLPSIPAVEDPGPGRVVVWDPAEDAQALSARIVDRDAPARVVVLSHPRCGFSRRAIAAIEADPALSARLRDALWLAMGPLYRHEKSQLWSMVADPAALLARAGGSAVFDTAEPPAALPWMSITRSAQTVFTALSISSMVASGLP